MYANQGFAVCVLDSPKAIFQVQCRLFKAFKGENQMIVEPKIRGFICTTAHPQGCAKNIQNQVNFIKKHPLLTKGPKKVLVIGASTGYGLASRIAAAFGAKADTIGVFYERSAEGKRTASAGWYNTAAFEQIAKEEGLYAKSVNGDAFSDDIKQQTIELIQRDFGGKVDLVIYSLASPRRQDPKTGEIYNSTLKPIGQAFTSKTVNVMTGEVSDISIEPATQNDIEQTVKVMGGDDWKLWIEALLNANLLAPNAITLAYSYIGPKLTYPVYRHGTIGKAKEHLEQTAHELNTVLQNKIKGHAFVSINKALVTQASAAIPVVPLYISLLYKIMKERNIHEGCIEQIQRLFAKQLYSGNEIKTDEEGRIRIDDLEMRKDVQDEIVKLWQQVNTDNVEKISDLKGYRNDFYNLFGFNFEGVGYQRDLDIDLAIPSITETVK